MATFLDVGLVNYFSVNTGISEETLREMTYCDLLESLNKFNRKNRFSFKDLWFTGWRKRAENGLRICPICLKEDDKPFYIGKTHFPFTAQARFLSS